MAVTNYTPNDQNNIIHKIKVDFGRRAINKPIRIVQYDKNLPLVEVELSLDGYSYTLPAGADVQVRWGKKDRTYVIKNVLGCSPDRKKVYFEVDEQMTYFHGPANPILEVKVNNKTAGSSSMAFEIERNPVQETDIESDSKYLDLEQAKQDAQTAAQQASDAKIDAENAMLSTEQMKELVEENIEDLQRKSPNDNVIYALLNKGLIPISEAASHLIQIGVRYVVGQSSSETERVKIDEHGFMTVGENTGLIQEIGVDDVEGLSSFDLLPSFRFDRGIETELGKITRFYVNSYQREFTRLDSDGFTRHYIMQCATKLPGYDIPDPFVDDEGLVSEFIDVMSYEGVTVNGKYVSIPDVISQTASPNTYLTNTRAHDGLGAESRYIPYDEKLNTYLWRRWVIRLNTLDVQDKLLGAVSMTYGSTYLSIGNQIDSNEVVLTNSQSDIFRIGMTIVATTSTTNAPDIFTRRVVSIEKDLPTTGQTTIIFDGDPVTVNEGSIITSHPWMTGATDSVLGSVGVLHGNDGRSPIVIEGIENPWGNKYQTVAGVKIVGDEIWVTDKSKNYNYLSNVTGYTKLNTTIPLSNGYIKEITKDHRFPWVKLPVEVGGGAGSNSYYADYLYQSYSEGSYRQLLRSGFFYSGRYAGPLFCPVNLGLSSSYFTVAGRAYFRPLPGGLGDSPQD